MELVGVLGIDEPTQSDVLSLEPFCCQLFDRASFHLSEDHTDLANIQLVGIRWVRGQIGISDCGSEAAKGSQTPCSNRAQDLTDAQFFSNLRSMCSSCSPADND